MNVRNNLFFTFAYNKQYYQDYIQKYQTLVLSFLEHYQLYTFSPRLIKMTQNFCFIGIFFLVTFSEYYCLKVFTRGPVQCFTGYYDIKYGHLWDGEKQ